MLLGEMTRGQSKAVVAGIKTRAHIGAVLRV